MKKSFFICLFFFFNLTIGVVFFGKYYIENRIHLIQEDLLNGIYTLPDYTISMANVNGHWHFYNYTLILDKLTVKNKLSKNIIYMQNNAVIEINWLKSIFLQQPYYNNIAIDGAQFTIDIKQNGDLDLLSLNGEIIPGELDYKLILGFLAKLNQVTFSNSIASIIFNNKVTTYTNLKIAFTKQLTKHVLQLQANLAKQETTKISAAIEMSSNLIDLNLPMKMKVHLENFDFYDYIPSLDNVAITKLLTNNASINCIIHKQKISQLEINADAVQIANKYFSDDFNLTKFHAKINQLDNIYQAEEVNFTLDNQKISSKLVATLGKGGLINFTLNAEDLAVDVIKINKYLPSKLLHADLFAWLGSALKQGTITKVNFQVDENRDYIFKLDFIDLVLDYTDHWPVLSDLSGDLTLTNNSLEISANSSKIFGQTIDHLTAKIVPLKLANQVSPLVITGKIATTANLGLDFLEHSPLKTSVGDKIKNFQPMADLDLELKLEVPFPNPSLVKVLGDITVHDGSITIAKYALAVDKIQGALKFSNDAVFSDGLKINLFGQEQIFNFDYVVVPAKNNLSLLNFNIQDMLQGSIDFLGEELSKGEIKITHAKVSGDIVLPSSTKNEYKINLDLIDLSLLNNNTQGNNTWQNNLPSLDFNCNKCIMHNTNIGKMQLNLVPRSDGYDIINLSLQNDNYAFMGGAKLVRHKSSQGEFSLTGNIKINNFGDVLEQFNYRDVLLNGTGNIMFAVNWREPGKFKLSNLNGNAKIDISRGVIKGIHQGLGKIFSLLSIESIQRRLQLDFSDLSNNGLAFDKLTADFDFYSGMASTDKIFLEGPTARITLNGNVNLISKIIDMDMLVMPKVRAGLPVAAAVATGNPIVGAVVLVFDKTFGLKLDKMSRYNYKITGTLDSPVIKDLGSK